MKLKLREGEDDKWVHDSSLDYKGRLPLRSSTGSWKASLFVLAIEFSERLSYFALSANLITYLGKVMHQSLPTAVKNVNYWTGVTTVMPLLGGFLADAYTGRFPMIIISSIIYLMGIGLLTMGEFVPRMKPCVVGGAAVCSDGNHRVAFFLAIYSISVGAGGFKPCLESFGADQFDDDNSRERKQKMSYFNWWSSALCCGMILGVTVVVYLQDYVSWGIANLVLALSMAVTFLVFCVGRRFYRYRIAQGSPLIPLLQVIVAAFRNRNLSLPSSPDMLYELKSHGRILSHTDNLRFLDKAAIIQRVEGLSGESSSWRLATVTQVEEMKLLVNMIPIWLSSLAFGLTMAQAPTFFVKQSSTMDRKIGTSFMIPSASINAILAIGMITSIIFYDKILVPTLRKATGNERGMNILQRVGIGMAFSVLTMVIAAVVERKRLSVADSSTVSVFWLAPQLILMGVGDSLTLVGLQEYFYDQVPDKMRSMGMAFFLSVIGVGSFLSSILITIVDHVTEENGKDRWFGKSLKESRLDKFYWLLAVISSLNLCVFVCVANRYTYKNVKTSLATHS